MMEPKVELKVWLKGLRGGLVISTLPYNILGELVPPARLCRVLGRYWSDERPAPRLEEEEEV